MNDPYKVLGVSPNASESEIKAAYKELVKKYHPDQYQGSPLSEFAQEKMAEINAAYDAIMSQKRTGSYGNYNTGDDMNYQQIRMLIKNGNITAAEQQLDAVPMSMRNAEWYFLKGNVCYARGWINEAYNNFAEAYRMQPNNQEYSAAFMQLDRQRGGYMNGNPMGMGNMGNSIGNSMDCCTTLCCADACCECMGGDLIRCI